MRKFKVVRASNKSLVGRVFEMNVSVTKNSNNTTEILKDTYVSLYNKEYSIVQVFALPFLNDNLFLFGCTNSILRNKGVWFECEEIIEELKDIEIINKIAYVINQSGTNYTAFTFKDGHLRVYYFDDLIASVEPDLKINTHDLDFKEYIYSLSKMIENYKENEI